MTSAELAGLLRDRLGEDGANLLDDRAGLQAALREKAPAESRRIHVLLAALDAGMPARLKAADGALADGDAAQEAAQLVDQFGVAPDFAREAVETWAMALGRLPGAASPSPAAPEAAAEAPPVPAAGKPVPPPAPAPLPPLPLPPLPSQPGAHEASVLAEAGPASSPMVQTNPPAAGEAPPPVFPQPPELPVPSPDSTGPVAQPSGEVTLDLPPVQPLPPVRPLPPVQALPGVQPLPPAQALPGVQPLPGGGPSVRPLPGVQPLPGSGSTPPTQPLPGATVRPTPPPAWLRWAAMGIGVVLLGFGLLALIGHFAEDKPQPTPKPIPVPGPQAGGTTGGRTAEGFPIVDAQTQPDVKAQRLDGHPDTLLFTFGLRFGTETYTYQTAVEFTRGDGDGAGLVKAFKGGRESVTDTIRTSRSIQSNGYLGFTVSGPLKGAASAPDVCVSALVGKTPGRFDLGNGGGLFCAFATKAGGVCDGDVKIGCGNLLP